MSSAQIANAKITQCSVRWHKRCHSHFGLTKNFRININDNVRTVLRINPMFSLFTLQTTYRTEHPLLLPCLLCKYKICTHIGSPTGLWRCVQIRIYINMYHSINIKYNFGCRYVTARVFSEKPYTLHSFAALHSSTRCSLPQPR